MTLLIDRKQQSDKMWSVMNIRWLNLLLLGCLLIAFGCRTTEQPPEEPMVTEVPEPPVEKFSTPTPWEPTGQLPWELTDSEKEKVIEIALKVAEASEWFKGQQYTLSDISWYALWDSGMSHYDEERLKELKMGAPNPLPNEANFYPGLTIIGSERQMQIAVDIASETVVYNSGAYPRRNGPIIP